MFNKKLFLVFTIFVFSQSLAGLISIPEIGTSGIAQNNIIHIRSCKCSSGCGMIQNGLRKVIKKYVKAAGAAGIRPVSCIRTQKCQDRLRACYERCGQRGRAAKKSKHADGKACDFSKRDGKKLTTVKRRTGLPIKRLTHGREGGGLHEYE